MKKEQEKQMVKIILKFFIEFLKLSETLGESCPFWYNRLTKIRFLDLDFE